MIFIRGKELMMVDVTHCIIILMSEYNKSYNYNWYYKDDNS